MSTRACHISCLFLIVLTMVKALTGHDTWGNAFLAFGAIYTLAWKWDVTVWTRAS